MNIDRDDMMSAEEFFGGISDKGDKSTGRGGSSAGDKKAGKTDLFTETKIKLVMRMRGFSRAKAEKFLERRSLASAEAESTEGRGAEKTSSKLAREFDVDEFFAG